MSLVEVCRELLCRGFLFFAVRGRGAGCGRDEALSVAKAPLNVPRGFRYCVDCGVEYVWVSEESLRLVYAGEALGVGVAGAPNRIVWIDIDCSIPLEKVLRLFPPDKCYVETTPRGGVHVGLYLDDESRARFSGVKGIVDNKTFGYVITSPTVLEIEYGCERRCREVLRYVKVSTVDVWDIEMSISTCMDSLDRLLRYALHVRAGIGDVRIESVEGVRILDTAPTWLENLVSRLPTELALAYAYAVFRLAGCGECVRYYVEKLIRNEPIEMPNITYPTKIERGLHTAFEIELLGSLKIAGLSSEQLYDVASRIRYTVDGAEYHMKTPPVNNLRYNVLRGTYSIAFKGVCPILLANSITGRYVNHRCTTTMSHRVSRTVVTELPTIVRILREIVNSFEEMCMRCT